MKRSWAVMAVLLTSSACDMLFPQPYSGPPLPEEGRLGYVSDRLVTPACPNATVFTGVSVIFENLGPCEQRHVDLYAMQASGPYETDFVGGLLPDRVPSTGSTPVVTFTADELLTTRGGTRVTHLVVDLRCAGDVVDSQVLLLHNEGPVPVSNVTLAPGLDRENVFLQLRDDAGLIAVTAAPWSMVGTATVPLSLVTTATDGSTVTRLDDVVSLSPDRFNTSKNHQGHGPAIERLGNGSYFVRLLDDVGTPHEGWAALIDRDGGVVRTWTDQAILHAERVGERLVLLRAPLARDDLARSVVVDVLDAATGAPIAIGLDTPWRSSDLAGFDPSVFVAAVDDNRVDLVYSEQTFDPNVGPAQHWTYTRIRAGNPPLSLPVDLPELEAIPGGVLDVTSLDAADGRLLVMAGWQGLASIVALNEAGDDVEIVEQVGSFSDGAATRWHTRSRTGNALVVSLAGHYLYFRDDAFVCAMRTSRPFEPVTVTDDGFILVNGDLMTTCTNEHQVDIGIGAGIGTDVVETDNGFSEVRQNWETRSVWVVALYPLEKLLALAPQTTPLQ